MLGIHLCLMFWLYKDKSNCSTESLLGRSKRIYVNSETYKLYLTIPALSGGMDKLMEGNPKSKSMSLDNATKS